MGGAEFEAEILVDAQKHDIFIALIDDDWGSFRRREKMEVLFYLTIDDLSKQMLHKERGGISFIMGDDAVGVTPDPKVIRQVNILKSRGKKTVLLYGNKDPRTRGAVELALACLRESWENSDDTVVLIPKFHPGAQGDFKMWCRQQVNETAGRFPGCIQDVDGHSDHIAALADATIGVGGTGMRTACHRGNTPLLTWTEPMGEMLTEETGGRQHPLVLNELALEVCIPNPFSELLKADAPLKEKRKGFFSSAKRFDPDEVAKLILEMGM